MATRSPLCRAFASMGLAALLVAGLRVPSGAGEEPQPIKTARGGLLAKAGHSQFEVFFYPTGVRVFPQDHAGTAVDASQFAGTATFYHPNSPKPWFSRPLHGTPASLDLAIGLSKAPQAGVKVAFETTGLSGTADSRAAFTVPLEFIPESLPHPSVAQPTAPAVAAPSPRYVYGPGYHGFGYYQYPGPETVPAQTSAPKVYSYTTPARPSSGGSSGSTHDWSTGRDYPAGGLISKPWLRPMD